MAEPSTSQPTSAAPTGVSSQPSEKSLKRKLEDALQTLDEAVGPTTPTLTRPPPPKRLRTARSIYSTLAKYGIKKDTKPQAQSGDLESLSKTAPHLAAILSRTASRTRKALPFKLGQATKPSLAASPTASEYRSSSTASFLARLSTYKLSTYGNKPPAIDAVAAAKCGWINDGKDRLVCGICGVSWVVASRDGMTRDAANALVEKQRMQLVQAHKDGCPWKTRQCDDSIYHVPLQAPLATIRDIKSRAIVLDTVMQGVEIKHPLVQSVLSIISSVSLPSSSGIDEEGPSTPGRDITPTLTTTRQDASETAVLTALFGWSILPPAPPSEHFKTPSISRAGSVVPATPSRGPGSRASSVARDSTPTPTTPRPPLRMSSTASVSSRLSFGSTSRPDTTLLHCALCQRRVGLWAFLPKRTQDDDSTTGNGTTEGSAAGGTSKPQQPQRQLDILREHRPYCPYVVRSTTVPSLPVPSQQQGHGRSLSLASLAAANGSNPQMTAQPTLMEGWRAVMTVVQRYGALQRQRLGLKRVPSGRIGESSDASAVEGGEVQPDPIEAMVADVKSHGGRDLLRYVKGLLVAARHVSSLSLRLLSTDVPATGTEGKSFREMRARDKIGDCCIGGKSTPHRIHTVSFQPRGVDHNEDRVVMDKWDIYGQPRLFLAVFDGHLGPATAEYASKALPLAIRKKLLALVSSIGGRLDRDNIAMNDKQLTRILNYEIEQFDMSVGARRFIKEYLDVVQRAFSGPTRLSELHSFKNRQEYFRVTMGHRYIEQPLIEEGHIFGWIQQIPALALHSRLLAQTALDISGTSQVKYTPPYCDSHASGASFIAYVPKVQTSPCIDATPRVLRASQKVKPYWDSGRKLFLFMDGVDNVVEGFFIRSEKVGGVDRLNVVAQLLADDVEPQMGHSFGHKVISR
ncbi:hypothetical protein BN946_scf184945.g66 [Trametes cinnabarina]|uniref:C3HC-type domain-containing protein n=1 Tax=Pycnoporus cinnabarinus TaxID=5643 RepID=A0A060SRZ4_PYCCI|nr:hypothetical protein BN946_scf184945.g66 [Trametes cinnabarina]